MNVEYQYIKYEYIYEYIILRSMVAGIGHRHPLFYGIFVIINNNIIFLRFEASSVAWFYIIIIYIINYNKFNYYYYI